VQGSQNLSARAEVEQHNQQVGVIDAAVAVQVAQDAVA
jgi:hypothetical protein